MRDKHTESEFHALPRDQQEAIKKRAGWHVGGKFKSSRRTKESTRFRNTIAIDIDAATPALLREIERGKTALARYAFVAHETHKSTDDAPRIRVIVWLADKIFPEHYEGVARAVARMLVPDLEGVDEGSFEHWRLMYWPSRPAGAGYWHVVNDGEFLNAAPLIGRREPEAAREGNASSADLSIIAHNRRQFDNFEDLEECVMRVSNDSRFDTRDAWRDFLAAIHFESEGSEEGRALAHKWSSTWSGHYDEAHTDQTWDSLRDDAGRRLTTGRLIIKRAREDGWKPKPKPGRIVIRAEDLIENLAALDAACAAHSEPLGLYRRSGLVVHVQREREPAIFEGERTEAWSQRIVQTSTAQMQQHAMGACSFEVYDARSKKNKPTQCPATLASHYLQMVGDSKLPVLRALINHPTIRPDGSVLQTSGFDRDTGLLYQPDADFPHVPDNPSMDDARAALKRLKRVVRGFEFATDLDCSVWLSAVLTALVRDSLPRAPFFAFDAPLPGSGKTILASGVSMIARGFTAAPTSQTDPDEERKTVASLLMRNAPFLFFDNCEHPVQSSTLCEIATSPEWEARLLGTNLAPKLPTNIVVMFTGNNLEIVGDIIERTLMCRLQPTTGRPSERAYGWSFEGECKERRAELVAAGLTIIRAFVASGASLDLKPSRFPEWERFARLPLAWLGEGDVIDTIEHLRQVAAAEDTDAQFLSKLVDAWWEDYGDGRVRLGDIEEDSNAGHLFKLLADRFEGETFDAINVRAAGKFLSKHKGQIVDGKFFTQKFDRNGNSSWSLKRTDE